MMNRFAICFVLICLATSAHAHASEQGFVLLLPTTLYVIGGVASVALTVVLIALVPPEFARRVFVPVTLMRCRRIGVMLPSVAACIALFALLIVGVTGSQDPTTNPLPLTVWSLFWVAFVVVQAVFGDIWRYINPWTGPWLLLRRAGIVPVARLPSGLGYWPAVVSFLVFAAVLLAHPAPADPDNLARMVLMYWCFHMGGALVFGPRWLRRGEGLTVLLECYARNAVVGCVGGRMRFGVFGWKSLRRPAPPVSLAILMITLLAVGSFDGLNETFWWLGKIGINPLAFPGRSAVIGETLIGLAIVVPALVGFYGLAVWLGLWLLGKPSMFEIAFCTFAPAILPIALGYHFGHYLTSFLVDIQYVAKYTSQMLNLREVVVTTGFFNSLNSVRVIWLSQAGAVVGGHVIAILVSHVLALNLFGSHKRAMISQIPLAAFMIAYTVFGLWLLASPRG